MQDLAFGLLETPIIGLGPLIPLQSLPNLQQTNNLTYLKFTNLLRVHSIPSSRPSVKILNSTGLNTESWETPLVTEVNWMWHHPLPLSGPATQPVSNLAKGAHVQAMVCQLFQENVMEK